MQSLCLVAFFAVQLLILLGLEDGSFSDFFLGAFIVFVLFSSAQIYNLCEYLFIDSLGEEKQENTAI